MKLQANVSVFKDSITVGVFSFRSVFGLENLFVINGLSLGCRGLTVENVETVPTCRHGKAPRWMAMSKQVVTA